MPSGNQDYQPQSLSDFKSLGLRFDPGKLLSLRKLGVKLSALSKAEPYRYSFAPTHPSINELWALFIHQQMADARGSDGVAWQYVTRDLIELARQEVARLQGVPYDFEAIGDGMHDGWFVLAPMGNHDLIMEATKNVTLYELLRGIQSFGKKDPEQFRRQNLSLKAGLQRRKQMSRLQKDAAASLAMAAGQLDEMLQLGMLRLFGFKKLLEHVAQARMELAHIRDNTSHPRGPTKYSKQNPYDVELQRKIASKRDRRTFWLPVEKRLPRNSWNDRRLARLIATGHDRACWVAPLWLKEKNKKNGDIDAIMATLKNDRKSGD